MAAALEDLQKDLARALELGDPDRINAVRRTIAEGHPGTSAAAEASYRLGVAALFGAQDLDEAMARLKAAAKSKDKTWTPRARVSLGLLLFRQDKVQQALFELRKVAGAPVPTLDSAQALGFIAMIHRDTNKGAEAERVRGQQLELLGKLVKSEDAAVSGLAHYMLGMEHKFDGQRREATSHLEAALAGGGLAPEDAANVRAALDDL